MTKRRGRSSPSDQLAVVRAAAAGLPGIEESVRYDGATVLTAHNCFMAAIATHPSAAPNTLVVKFDADERQWLLDDAPETYYVTDYYRPHPVVLVRLAHIEIGALRDLLSTAHRIVTARNGRTAKRDRPSRSV